MKSDYHAEIIQDVLCIYDLNKGNMSVTNNIENVLKEIFQSPEHDGLIRPIIYMDSDGIWDEVKLTEKETFQCFAYIGVDLLGLAIAVVKNRRGMK